MKFVVLKVLDSQGLGSTSNVISAIQFATANKTALGIDIINLSLGHAIYEPAATDPLVLAVEAASQAGLVVVVSAGNYGTNTHDRPGRLRGDHLAGQRAVRDHRRRRERTRTRLRAATIASPTTARVDRRGTTAWRSRMSSRRARSSRRTRPRAACSTRPTRP